MPLYEFTCCSCHQDCELLLRGAESPVCPACGSRELEKQWSVPAAPNTRGSELPISSGGMCGRPQCASGGCQGLG